MFKKYKKWIWTLVKHSISRWSQGTSQWHLYRATLCYWADSPCSNIMWLNKQLASTQHAFEYPLKWWMNEYVLHIKTSTQNIACSQCHMYTAHTCRLSQAKTTKDMHTPKCIQPPPPSPPQLSKDWMESLMLLGRPFKREGGTHLMACLSYCFILESMGLGTSRRDLDADLRRWWICL